MAAALLLLLSLLLLLLAVIAGAAAAPRSVNQSSGNGYRRACSRTFLQHSGSELDSDMIQSKGIIKHDVVRSMCKTAQLLLPCSVLHDIS
jgi:hypothetical protein